MNRNLCARVTISAALLAALAAASFAQSAKPTPGLPSEMPAKFVPVTKSFDYDRRVAEISMRDGVRLHTVILVPRSATKGSAGLLLTRTPYDADALTAHISSEHLGPTLYGYDNATDVIVEDGYIRVFQDVRGKYGSEGDYVINRPLRGPLNPTNVDHATDTWDTIDWLVKNVPESNGRVGTIGISYNGFLPLMSLFNPHPALKCSVPMNPMVDGWIGDDWFHNGAFRQQGMGFIYNQQATRKNEILWWTDAYDDYDTYMNAVNAGELGKSRGMEQLGFWRQILAHPSYDAYWQNQAVDKLLAKEPLKVPVMLVHSLWDQEDIYGAPAVYRAIEPKDTANDMVFLAMGPWHHGQMIWEGSSLGAIQFDSDTSKTFRQTYLRPFLAQHLKNGPKAAIPPVAAFETGTNTWRHYDAWPVAPKGTPLSLTAGGKLALAAPPSDRAAVAEYVSDPARPVPYIPRPVLATNYDKGENWKKWLVSDQREASGRPDVAVFVTDVLKEPVKIAGEPVANLVASTSGTDSDWVVKLIDVYPPEVAGDPGMGGYQLMVAADIFRGRYRESLEAPKAITPDAPLLYRFALPTSNHVFRPGHRIMVQVQSSWFPLYDRNPQTFVPSIFWAKPEDYRKATQRIYAGSFIDLPVAR
jgi:putative CocE/NonD family hydrolase